MRVSYLPLPWREPVDVLSGVADLPFAVGLLSGGAESRWSYVASRPVGQFSGRAELAAGLEAWGGSEPSVAPFSGGAIGLASYEWGASLEPSAPQARSADWPDLVGGFYDAVYAFDHAQRRVWAIGRGETTASAEARAEDLAGEYGQAPDRDAVPAAAGFLARTSSEDYRHAVAAVVEAIAAGEIFQANIARHWSGHLPGGIVPFDVMAQLVLRSPAPFAGYLRLPGLALVSNSPERFMEVTASGAVRTQPIKGTRPRGRTQAEDAAFAAELLASEKDHAENLMIVDLMRNDLARTCAAGSVRVPSLCALQSFANVHHLVSTVTGRLAPQMRALDAFALAFPPGSITGAPKLQAMAVIARHEAPRGPYCGSLFWAGCDGAFDSSVLIRSIAFAEDDAGAWRFDVRAGAAITADSVPAEEDAETEAKIAAIRHCLSGR